jgi:phosphatidylglycerophosphate synthase
MSRALGLDDAVAPLMARMFGCVVHPNVITACAIPVTLCIFYALLQSGANAYALLIGLAVFRALLDTADGAVARKCHLASHTGAVFDIASDTFFLLGLVLIGGWAVTKRAHPVSVVGFLLALVSLGICIKQIVFSARTSTPNAPKSLFEKVLASNSIITSTIAVVWVKLMVDIARGY